jgi:hypothetical protein
MDPTEIFKFKRVAQWCVAHAHSAGSDRGHSARGPQLAGPASAYAARDGVARRVVRRGRQRCYSGGGGAKDGARATTAERLLAGHGGGGDSSPELHVDGAGEKNRIGGGVLQRGEGSGGRRWSCVRVEGEGARLNIPRKKKQQEGLGFRSPWKSSRWWRHPDNNSGMPGQRRSAQDTDDGAVRMSAREAR